MVVALGAAIALDQTIAEGKSKAVFLGVFVVAFVGKTFLRQNHGARLIILLITLSAFHVFLVFILPNDSTYPGALLLPAGLLEIACIYVIAMRVLVVKSSKRR